MNKQFQKDDARPEGDNEPFVTRRELVARIRAETRNPAHKGRVRQAGDARANAATGLLFRRARALQDRSSVEVVTLIMSGGDDRSTEMIASNGLLAHCRSVQHRSPDKLPVVKLATGQYKNKRFGMLPKPLFRIVGLAPKESAAVPDTSPAA